MIIGHQKGRSTKENLRRNFGMARPEGFRKAQRLLRLAARFSIPVITLIDTPGAYPGIGAEERGQAEAIASSLELMASLPVPVVSVVIGEGGSGGALALGVANRILMMEYATYSVISPEGCASILWKDAGQADQAAEVMGLRSRDLLELKIADQVIEEPEAGAHRLPQEAGRLVAAVIRQHLNELSGLSGTELVEDRYRKYRSIGVFLEEH
jgi:acetyl-CoA carboxylase carboxyl transferase subunit alpha